ncbi:hypothetical protein RS030_112 [Cryptosporidium xiaoi]|uniref:Uncharacterized protein n=1 Tax=Cryptosporidium xiaoi TaxID=659607 RepID=A0AAV9XY06_9CRYT
MLEQLKQRWISKLNDLCLGITNSESNRGNGNNSSLIIKGEDEGWIPRKNEIFSPVLDGVKPIKLNCYSKGNKQKVNESVTSLNIRNNLVPIISSKEMRNLNELETEYEYCQKEMKKKRLDTEQAIRLNDSNAEFDKITSLEGSVENRNNNNNDSGKEDEDDDFGDASWDIVAPNSEKDVNNLDDGNNFDTDNSEKDQLDVISDQGSDLENVSELEDDEPECNDVIIGHFERIIRPYSRKQNQKGKWRVRLRNGIAQIANQEIPFDTLIGEFEF